MGIIITILYLIAGIIALLLIIALFTKKEYALHRDIIIKKPQSVVFDYVRHLKNQDYFSKWVMTDPHMKKTFKGTDGTVGFVYAWDSKNKQAGAGEQEIIEIKEGEKINIEVRFLRPLSGLAYIPFITKSISEQETKLTWGMSSKMKYPMNIMLLVMNIEKVLGNDLQVSLENLKTILEK
jgi:hypothetical protein